MVILVILENLVILVIQLITAVIYAFRKCSKHHIVVKR